MKLKEAVKKAEESIEETLACCDFPSEHWARIHINNAIERLNREIRRHNRRVGSFPNGKCGRCPVGQQELHEHEAPKGRH